MKNEFLSCIKYSPIIIKLVLVTFLNLQGKPQPVRLEKKQKSQFQLFCERVAPYILLICMTILIITILVVLIKYGANITGTEANQYYNHMGAMV